MEFGALGEFGAIDGLKDGQGRVGMLGHQGVGAVKGGASLAMACACCREKEGGNEDDGDWSHVGFQM